MSKTVISHASIVRDFATFQPITERVYGSGERLVATPSGLTADISSILSSSQNHETFAEVIREAVQAQRDQYGCGGRTVALFICLFYNCMRDVIEEGIERTTVFALSEIALEYCISKLDSICRPFSDLSYAELAARLAHGIQEPQLAAQALERLYGPDPSSFPGPINTSDFPNNITICSERSSKPSSVYSAQLIKSGNIAPGPTRVLLVAGDVIPNPTHIGYKGLVKETIVTSGTGNISSSSSWHDNISRFLSKLEVGVVLSTGLVDPVLAGNPSVTLVPEIGYSSVARVAELHGSNLLPFLESATPDDVMLLEFQECDEGWYCVMGDTPHVTILLRNLQDVGARYKCFVARLGHAINRGSVLPGAGETERFCSETLQSFVVSEEDKLRYELCDDSLAFVVSRKLAEVFERTAGLAGDIALHFEDLEVSAEELCLESEESKERGGEIVCDEFTSKSGAWRRALQTAMSLVSTVLTLRPIGAVA